MRLKIELEYNSFVDCWVGVHMDDISICDDTLSKMFNLDTVKYHKDQIVLLVDDESQFEGQWYHCLPAWNEELAKEGDDYRDHLYIDGLLEYVNYPTMDVLNGLIDLHKGVWFTIQYQEKNDQRG